MTKKICISGYYGFDNFGDELILKVLIENIKSFSFPTKTTVFSSNPIKTSKELGVNSVILTGLHTHMCVRHTSADAYQLGYEVNVCKDCTDSFTEEDYNYGIKYLKDVYGANIYSVDELINWMEK